MSRANILLFYLFVSVLAVFPDAGHCSSSAPAAKYVFYFIGDGMGICQVFGTELFMNLSEDDRDEKLAFTSFPVKSIITTHSASSLVTDSAAAGTALACGAKTNNDMLGVDPEGAELISLADLAKHEGYATGVVSNVAVNHATPGAFYAHQSDRLDYEAISRDLLDANMDFIGGATFLVSKNAEQGAEWWKRACRKAGIHVCHTADEVRRTESGRIVMLSDDLQRPSLRYAIDRTDSDMELSDLTTAAIDFLDRNAKKGFFLMIEGGKIDYACHDNDAATLSRPRGRSIGRTTCWSSGANPFMSRPVSVTVSATMPSEIFSMRRDCRSHRSI